MNILSENLKRLREARNLSFAAMADLYEKKHSVKLGAGYFSTAEKDGSLNVSTAAKIADTLNVVISELFTRIPEGGTKDDTPKRTATMKLTDAEAIIRKLKRRIFDPNADLALIRLPFDNGSAELITIKGAKGLACMPACQSRNAVFIIMPPTVLKAERLFCDCVDALKKRFNCITRKDKIIIREY